MAIDMNKALTELCHELNNWFWRKKVSGHFAISGGTLNVDFLQEGQYFRIIGSVFNDGVHVYPATDLHDETFDGAIWSMAVPAAVIDLATDISEWQTKYGAVDSAAMSPYNSESFGNYSYSKSSGSSGGNGLENPNSWQTAFASRLSKYRRLRGAT